MLFSKKVKVVYVSAASRWWVSVLSHMPATGTRDDIHPNTSHNLGHDLSLVMKMSIRMAEYYTIPENKHMPGETFTM